MRGAGELCLWIVSVVSQFFFLVWARFLGRLGIGYSIENYAEAGYYSSLYIHR